MADYFNEATGEWESTGEPAPVTQTVSPYDPNAPEEKAWQASYQQWVNAGAQGSPPTRPITNLAHPQHPSNLLNGIPADMQAKIAQFNANPALASLYGSFNNWYLNQSDPFNASAYQTGSGTGAQTQGTATQIQNWTRAFDPSYTPATTGEAQMLKAIRENFTKPDDYFAADKNGSLEYALKTGKPLAKLPEGATLSTHIFNPSTNSYVPVSGASSGPSGNDVVTSGGAGTSNNIFSGGYTTNTGSGTTTNTGSGTTTNTGSGTTTNTGSGTNTNTNTNTTVSTPSSALRSGAPAWLKSFASAHPDLLNNWTNAQSNPNDPNSAGIKGYGSLENYLTQSARAFGTDEQKAAAQNYNPTTSAPSPTNPATGQQWTYSDLMNRYITEHNGQTPSGAQFNEWAGSVIGDGADWTNTDWTPSAEATSAMSNAAGGAGGAGGSAAGGAATAAGGSVGNLSSAGGAGGSVGNISINTGSQYQPIELKDAQGNPIRNLVGEGASTLAAQVALAPQMFEQYKQYAPQYAQQDILTLGRSLYGPNWSGTLDDLNRQMTESAATQTNRGNQIARESAMADINTFGGQTAEAMRNLNPALWQNLDTLDAQARAGVTPSQYQTGLGNIFNQWSANPTITAQQVTGPQITQNQVAGGTPLSATGVSAQQITPGTAQTSAFAAPSAIGAQNVQAQQLGGPANVSAADVGVERLGGPLMVQGGSLSAQNVGAERLGGPMMVQNQGISAPAVQAAMVQNPFMVGQQDNPLLAMAAQQAAYQGNTPLGDQLQQQAQQQLALGGGLSDEQRRNAQQAAREAWGARGLINSAGAVGAEVLARDAYSQQLQQQRQQFAQGVAQLGQGQQGLNNQYTLGVLGAAGQQAGLNQQGQIANQSAFQNAAQLNQAANMQAQLANQDASMRAQQANQATGLQAQQLNQQALLQTGQLNQATGLQAQLANQSAGLSAAQASLQAQLQAQQANQQAMLQTGQLNQATGLQAGLANQDAALRAQLANQQAGIQVGQLNQQSGLQAQLANQGAGLTAAQANLQAQLQAAQSNQQNAYQTQALNLQNSLAAQQANQAAGLQAGQLNQQNIFAVGQANQQDALQRALANQQNAYQTQAANQGALFGASQANQSAGLQAQQAQEALRLQALGQQMGLGQSLAGLDYANQQQGFSNLAQASQMRTANQIDPFRILSIGTANQGTNQGLFGQGAGAASGSYGNQSVLQQFNPYSAYSSDLFNTNFNAGESRYLNAQNNAANLAAANAAASATKSAGKMSGLGNLIGAGIGAFAAICWVAREVYGEDNPKWKQFRVWLTTRAPSWFYRLYATHGENFAAWLKNHTWAKPPIRWFMDACIRSMEHSTSLKGAH